MRLVGWGMNRFKAVVIGQAGCDTFVTHDKLQAGPSCRCSMKDILSSFVHIICYMAIYISASGVLTLVILSCS